MNRFTGFLNPKKNNKKKSLGNIELKSNNGQNNSTVNPDEKPEEATKGVFSKCSIL